MNILITGGAGYIGFALAEKLAENPAVDKIVLYDNLSRHNENVFLVNWFTLKNFTLFGQIY